MKEYEALFEAFKELYVANRHYIEAEYNIYTPKSELLTLSGSVSARAVDCDAHKLMQDTIFRVMEMDDKLIRDVVYRTPISLDDKWNYVITYKLRPIEALYV